MGMTAALSTTAIGTGFSMYAKITAGNKQQQMFDQNAKFAKLQADDAIARGAHAEMIRRRGTERVIGAQRVGFAAQHVDVNTGSALDVQADAAYLGELDVVTIRNNAAKEAYGYKVEAYNASMHGVYAKEFGQMDAINTLLGSASNLAIAGMDRRGGTRRDSQRQDSLPSYDYTSGTDWPT
jgi:hypothetical protein